LHELVAVSGGVEAVATTLGLRGFEVAAVEPDPPVIDFEITANRPDCLSIIGLAREAAAAYALPLRLPDRTVPPAQDIAPLDVEMEDADGCPRYCAQIFAVRLGPSPAWLRERLEAAGLRSINNVVDVTNYVMVEMGQPTHAFDLERLGGRALRIRAARPRERLRTLDGVDRTLEAGMLVIADAERPQAVGGVMGGAASEISDATKTMVLESAYFKPSSVRRTSRRLALKTEASSRFERGADIEAAPAAIARIAALLHQIGAAQPLGPMIDRYPFPRERRTLTLRSARITRVLGVTVADREVPSILGPLGFEVTPAEGHGKEAGAVWTVGVPSFRVDVLREVDLIEEIARHDGYQGLPPTFPVLETPQPPPDARTLRDRRVRHVLTACGLSEAMTFAFIERQAAAPFANGTPLVAVLNPLSEKYDTLRPSLLPGLVDSASHNRRRERRDIRLFETGTRFSPSGEVRAVAGVWAGAATAPHWSGGARAVDFFDLKGVVDALTRTLGVAVTFTPASLPYLVDGRTASVQTSSVNGLVGHVGQLDPGVVEARGFPRDEELYGFELDLDAVAALQASDDLRAESLPRFPSVVRDLSILVDSVLPAATVRGTIRSAAPLTLVQVAEFDRYRGKGVPEGRVSLSLRLTFRSSDRTLTDQEVDEAMARIVSALASQHGAERR
jgi:phenylalanyl-tRNA synthetase beta chain